MKSLQEIKQHLAEKRGERDALIRKKERLQERLKFLKKELAATSRAKLIIQHVALQTQKELEYKISEPVTVALGAINDKDYRAGLEFIERSNRTEAEFFLYVNDDRETRIDPMTESGGGIVDIASFALRVAMWSIEKNRPTIVLDEPFRYISSRYRQSASLMLKKLSKALGLQFIIVTHEPALLENADRVFEVYQKNGVSEVTTRKDNT